MSQVTDAKLNRGNLSFAGVINMTGAEFDLFSNLIYSQLGIKMPPSKKLMLTSRLNKRVKALGYRSYKDYYDFIMNEKGTSFEFNRMIEAVTTNKTDFFRESAHFDILVRQVLPELTAGERFKRTGEIKAWSAGCSTGEEPYTIAMVLSEYFPGRKKGFNTLATDISIKVLKAGMDAIYKEEAIKPLSLEMRKKYLLRGTGENAGLYRIVPELRKKVYFKQLNLMDDVFKIDRDFDFIFCRNVIIYFDKSTQVKLFEKIYNHLNPGGYLFIGSSETLHGVSDRFKPIAPTVYKKSDI
ncbi:MAG: protein-glutamate O-methyltransferase [Spirochaetota bacterium]